MEQPNTRYIDQLAGDNIEFRDKIIVLLKKELPEEIADYKQSLERGNFNYASEIVHKLKNKISMLGLQEGYEIAGQFERDLNQSNMALQDNFESILSAVEEYTASL